jgi:hypothetical protein
MGKVFKTIGRIAGGFAGGVVGGPISSVAGAWLLFSQLGQQTNYTLPKNKAELAQFIATAVTGALLLGGSDPKFSAKSEGKENQ